MTDIIQAAAIRTSRLEIVDSAGNVRITAAVDGSDRPEVVMADEMGTRRLAMRLHPARPIRANVPTAELSLHNRSGDPCIRIALMPDMAPHVLVESADGTTSAKISVPSGGMPQLALTYQGHTVKLDYLIAAAMEQLLLGIDPGEVRRLKEKLVADRLLDAIRD